MNALIQILEKATGPGRVLDADIAQAAGHKVYQVKRQDGQGSWTRYEFRDGSDVPAYTASIDAALTLVPEGWAWSVHGGEGVCAGATLSKMSEEGDPFLADREIEANEPPYPALCLCLAALRARASRE